MNSIFKGSTQPCPCDKIYFYFFIQAYHFTFTTNKHHCIYIIQKVVDTNGEKRGCHVKANQITVTTWDGISCKHQPACSCLSFLSRKNKMFLQLARPLGVVRRVAPRIQCNLHYAAVIRNAEPASEKGKHARTNLQHGTICQVAY